MSTSKIVERLRGLDWWHVPEDESQKLFEEAANRIDALEQALKLIAEMDGDQPARSDWDMGRIARKALGVSL
jgi:hypothetical protein